MTDPSRPISEAEWWIIIVTIVLMGAIIFGIGYAILRSARYPQPTMLVMSLSLLTMLTVTIFVATNEADLLTLTGVGLGALAGAVNAMFTGGKSAKEVPVETEEESNERTDSGDSDTGTGA